MKKLKLTVSDLIALIPESFFDLIPKTRKPQIEGLTRC